MHAPPKPDYPVIAPADLAKFDAFIERGRKQVLEERNQFKIGLAELQGRHGPKFLEELVNAQL